MERGESTSSIGSYVDTYCRLVGQPTPQEHLPELAGTAPPLPAVGEAPDTSCDFAIAKAIAETDGARACCSTRTRAALTRQVASIPPGPALAIHKAAVFGP